MIQNEIHSYEQTIATYSAKVGTGMGCHKAANSASTGAGIAPTRIGKCAISTHAIRRPTKAESAIGRCHCVGEGETEHTSRRKEKNARQHVNGHRVSNVHRIDAQSNRIGKEASGVGCFGTRRSGPDGGTGGPAEGEG